mgnify:CR=1 FL=1
MHITISHASQFRAAFESAGRASQFSYEAMNMLFEYFEEMDESAELDVVAICCEYVEETMQEAATSYNINIDGMDEEEAALTVLDYLGDSTHVVGTTSNSVVYAQF